MSDNGNQKPEYLPPSQCRGCGLKREEALDQYGGFIILPTPIPSILHYHCPVCGNVQANENCYELTKILISQQSPIVRPSPIVKADGFRLIPGKK